MITIGAGETSPPIDLISNEDANRLNLMVNDDMAMLYEFPEGFLFPFYGTNYHAAMVHTDGNITFRGEDIVSTARDEQRFLSGFPRIAPLFADLDPTQGGTVRAEFDSTDRIMRFHWENVPQFSESGGRAGNTFSVSLFPTGNVHFGYGAISLTEAADGTEAVVGLSRGGSAPSKTVDLSESPTGVIGVGSESIYEKFPSNTNFDLHTTNIRQLLFVVDEDPKGELTASPNPVSACDGSDLGRTTLSWSIPGTEAVEIRIGSPVGSLVGGGGSSGSIETGSWVKDGMVFYAVDSKDRSVLASEVVHVNSSGCGISLTANPVQTCANVSSVTLTWASPSTNTVEIRVGSPGGPLVFGGITGSKPTGNWVTDGMTFYMVNANNKRTLAKTTVSFDRTGCRASLSANPNPIQVCDGSGVGQTTLTWELGSSSLAEIRIGSPDRFQGRLLGQWRTSGSISLPKWVSNGMAFYLVDSINQAVLAGETVFHTTQNCTLPNLKPYQPAGWSAPIVVSTSSGTTTDSSTLLSTDKLFVDFAVSNDGSGPTVKRYFSTLSVDGQEVNTWFTDPPHNFNFYAYFKDYELGPLSPGTHILKLVADSTSQIVESNESDNEFTKTITIFQAGPGPPPPPTRGSGF